VTDSEVSSRLRPRNPTDRLMSPYPRRNRPSIKLLLNPHPNATPPKFLFSSTHHIASEERAVIRFIHSARREPQNRLRCILLACDKAIAVEFEKQDAGHEARTLVAIKERVVTHDTCRVGRRHIDDVSGLGIGMLLLRTSQGGLQQPTIAQTSSA
jgi:hypothetical protein